MIQHLEKWMSRFEVEIFENISTGLALEINMLVQTFKFYSNRKMFGPKNLWVHAPDAPMLMQAFSN